MLGVASELAGWVREQRRAGRAPPPCGALPEPRGRGREIAYRTPQAIRADYERDPILGTAALARVRGRATGEELANDYLAARDEVRGSRSRSAALPQMTSADEVMRAARAALARQSSQSGRAGCTSRQMSR